MGPFGTKNKHGRLTNIPKWSLMVQIDPKWSFGQSNLSLAIWDHFEPICRVLDQNNFFASKTQTASWPKRFGAKNELLSE